MKHRHIVLASGSPRRSELLQQIGIEPEILPMDIDEHVRGGESPEVYAVRLSMEKAKAALDLRHDAVVIGADTVVVTRNTILGKPRDAADHARMFALLSGRTHDVFTAVTVLDSSHQRSELGHSKVTFTRPSAAEISAYWQSGEPTDKAGGYGIQGKGALFVSELQGSYSGVMGLPLELTARLLAEFDINVWIE